MAGLRCHSCLDSYLLGWLHASPAQSAIHRTANPMDPIPMARCLDGIGFDGPPTRDTRAHASDGSPRRAPPWRSTKTALSEDAKFNLTTRPSLRTRVGIRRFRRIRNPRGITQTTSAMSDKPHPSRRQLKTATPSRSTRMLGRRQIRTRTKMVSARPMQKTAQ